MNLFFLLLLLLTTTILPPRATSHEILSCADTLVAFQSTWRTTSTSSSSSSTPKSTQNNTWYYEGANPSSSQEIKVVYTKSLAGMKSTYVYVEYFNDSPRRVLLETVKDGNLYLLPGDSGSGWKLDVQEVVGEVSLTTVLKKPQRLYLRKLVVFKKSDGALVDRQGFQKHDCNMLLSQGSRSNSGPTAVPTTTTQKPLATNRCVTTTTPPMATTTKSDCTCPECKCVCNCNCSKC